MTLVHTDANNIFGECTAVDNDYSLSALIRAIAIKYGKWELGSDVCTIVARTRISTTKSVHDFFSKTYDNNAVMLIECTNLNDDPITLPKGWTDKITVGEKIFPCDQYLSQFAKTRVFVNASKKRVLAVVSRRISHVWIQAFESILCRLMPWYFPLDLSDEEKALFKAISVGNKEITEDKAKEIFINFVNNIASQLDIRSMNLHKLLDGVADRARKSRIESVQNLANSLRRDIRQLGDRLADKYKSLSTALLELSGLETLSPKSDDAMFQFFSQHKQLSIINVSDDGIRFGVDDTLEFYDEDEFKRIYERSASFLHEYGDDTSNALYAIFANRLGVIRVNAVFKLEDFKLVCPMEDEFFVERSMPNPHIFFYGCSGGNDQYYSQYASEGAWDLGIEQAIAATKNLNWGDSTVCSRMIRWLTDSTTPCIYVNDGNPVETINEHTKLVTFNEFLEMIKKAEEHKGEK